MTANNLSNPSPRLRALIADDDASVRKLLQTLLEGEGCAVEAVADGVEALAHARAAPPDLLVTDAVMPGMDGFSLCRAIREDPRLKHLPVLLASASFRAPYDEQLAQAAGASAFLGKPAAIADWQKAMRLALAALPSQPLPEGEFTALRAKVFGELLVNRQNELTDKRARLSESETRFRDVLDNLNDLVFLVEPGSGHLVNANRRVCEFFGLTQPGDDASKAGPGAHDTFGYPCEGLASITLSELGPARESEMVRRALRDVIEKGSMVFECHLRRHDGTLILHEVNARRTVLGGWDVIVGVARDISERKQAQETLRQSEQRLRNIIDGLGPSMFVGLLTIEGVVLEANQQALAAAGLKPEDVLGKPVEETYWFSYSEESKRQMRTAVTRAAQGEASRYDVQIRATENQFIPLDFSVQPFRDTTGRVVLLVPSAIVITERKLAEQALREREHFLQRVLDTEPGTVYIYDLVARRNVFINRHWLSAYGYTAEDTQAMGEALLARIIHPDDLARVVAQHAAWQQAPEGVTRSIDYRVRSKVGEWRWLHSRETAFARDPAGQVTQILGIAHDITERKTAETALAERDALLNETGRIAKVGGWEFDPVTGKGSWTDEVARIHDLDPSAETSAEIGLSFYHGEHRARIEHAVREAVESGKSYDLELELISAKGVRKWVRTIGHPLIEHNRVVRVSGSFQDITDRKQAEAALRENTRQLETLSRRLLAAQEDERRNIARELHDELGQALTAIKINLQARDRFKGHARKELDAENVRIVDATLQQVRRLALTLRPSMLDDLGLGSALRWMADQQAERGGFAMHFGADFSDVRLAPELETACFRIAQEALTNIVRHAQARRVTIELRHARDALVMTVQDDGRGFDVAAMRAHAKTGSSFGLLGMQERAALAGGSLEIESAPNQGTILRARFPWRAPEEKR